MGLAGSPLVCFTPLRHACVRTLPQGSSPYIELKAAPQPLQLFHTLVLILPSGALSISSLLLLSHDSPSDHWRGLSCSFSYHPPPLPSAPRPEPPSNPLPQSVISEKLEEVFLFTDALGNFMVCRLMLSLSRCANICLIWYKLIVQKRKKPL